MTTCPCNLVEKKGHWAAIRMTIDQAWFGLTCEKIRAACVVKLWEDFNWRAGTLLQTESMKSEEKTEIIIALTKAQERPSKASFKRVDVVLKKYEKTPHSGLRN